MSTVRQIWIKSVVRKKKKHKCRTPALRGCPQKKGVVTNIVIIKPKKPNSAKRHVAKILITSFKKKLRASIPGEHSKDKEKNLKEYSKVYVRGGRARDLIGIRYKVILGVLDANPFESRRSSRSKYGVKKEDIKLEPMEHYKREMRYLRRR